LILDSGLGAPLTRTMAKRVGARVVEVKDANSFADIREVVRQVGEAVGEPERAAALVGRMDATLAELAAHPPARRARVVAWSGGTRWAPCRQGPADEDLAGLRPAVTRPAAACGGGGGIAVPGAGQYQPGGALGRDRLAACEPGGAGGDRAAPAARGAGDLGRRL